LAKKKKYKTPTYYTITPAPVRYDYTLNPYARILYGELTALSEIEGYAWATNNYLASLYHVDRSSISHWIKQLQDKGYIRIEFIYDETHCYVEERRIYLTGLTPEQTNKKGVSTNDLQESNEETSTEADEMHIYAKNRIDTEEGGDIYNQGGDVCNHGVVTNITRGGYKAPWRSLQAINTRSSSSDPPKIEKPPPDEEEKEIFKIMDNYSENCTPENFTEKSCGTDPPPGFSLKKFLRELNPSFIFSESFYQKAVDFLAFKTLDSGYISWLYDFCVKKKPKSLENYFFKVFFDDRCAELYLEESKPPPVKIFKCPICSTEHDSSLLVCPKCGLDMSFRNDQDKILAAKRFFEMPDEIKAAYREESNNIFKSYPDFEERIKKFKSLDMKYGLSP
jgi:DNA-binding MarR family transcriptional regulator